MFYLAADTHGSLELTSLLILIVGVWIGGKIFRRFNLPVLFGELLAGLVLGPVLLGVVQDTETIRILAELGVFFLMLHAGLESDPHELMKSSKHAFWIAVGGVLFPMILGYYVSVAFGFSVVESLFVGIGSSVTAVAVAARMFKDYGVMKTKMAHVTLGAALFGDILSLVLFSIILEISSSGVIEPITLLILSAKVILYFAVVLYVGHKFFPQIHKIIYAGNKGFTFTLIVALLFGLVAEWMGLHVIIGAFLAGLFIREEVIEERLFRKIEDRIYGVSYSFLGPIFFASLAFHLDFRAVTELPWFLVTILTVAVLGKIFGSGIIAKIFKYSNVESFGIGLSMNSRGAVELIIASIGLQQGIIDEKVFSVLVLMTFFTTIVSIIGMKPVADRLLNNK